MVKETVLSVQSSRVNGVRRGPKIPTTLSWRQICLGHLPPKGNDKIPYRWQSGGTGHTKSYTFRFVKVHYWRIFLEGVRVESRMNDH